MVENEEDQMLTQFSRTELLLGKEGMERLKNARVAGWAACRIQGKKLSQNREPLFVKFFFL